MGAMCQAVTAAAVAVDDADSKPNVYEHGVSDRKRTAKKRMPIEIDSPVTLNALADAKWPGRCQTLLLSELNNNNNSSGKYSYKSQNVRFYLDGAHTPQSLDATADWFRSKIAMIENRTDSNSGCDDSSPSSLPVLVFNCSHERNPVELLELLSTIRFSAVYFAKSDSSRPSAISKASAQSLLKERGIPIRDELVASYLEKESSPLRLEKGEETATTWQETLAIIWRHLTAKGFDTDADTCPVRCNATASQILDELLIPQQDLKQRDREEAATMNVFVTGSLYLVGSFLTALGWKEESSPPLI